MPVYLWYAQAFSNDVSKTSFRRCNIEDELTSVVKRMCDVALMEVEKTSESNVYQTSQLNELFYVDIRPYCDLIPTVRISFEILRPTDVFEGTSLRR